MNSENSAPETKHNDFDDEISQEREKEKDKQRSSFLNKLITSRTDEPLQEPKKHHKHNSLMKGSKKIMNKLFKLKSKNTLQKKENEEVNKEDKNYQQKEIRELLKSETMITRNVKSLNKEKKINDTIVAVMSFLSIIICFCQLYSLIDADYEMTSTILTLRTCILILSVPNLIFIYRRYLINLDIRKYNLKLKESTLWTSGYYKIFIIEILLNIVQPFPYLEFTFTYNQGDFTVKLSFSHICTVLMVVRIYLTYKLLNHYNVWTNARSKRISALQGVEANSVFATKVLLKNSPVTALILISVIFLFIFALLVRAFEFFDSNDRDNDFVYLWNSLWLTFITMSTVGYGESTPQTNFGKIFCIISCLMGIFLLSMLVAVLSLHVFFDSEELKVYRKIIEKEIVYTEMPQEIREVFNLLGSMFRTKSQNEKLMDNSHSCFPKKANKDPVITSNMALQKLLLRFKLKKLNDKKRMVLLDDDDFTELFLKKFDKHVDLDFGELSNKTVSIIRGQKRLYDIANNHPKVASKVFDSKDYANRIANLANLMRVISTCGKIQNIYDIEGGRLFSRKELVDYQKYFYYDTIYNIKKMEAVGQKKTKQTNKLQYSKSTV